MCMEYLFQVWLTIMVNVGTLWYTIFNRKYIFNPGPISSQLCYFFRSVTNRNGKKGPLVVWGICCGGMKCYTQLCRDYNKLLQGSLFNNQDSMKSKAWFFRGSPENADCFLLWIRPIFGGKDVVSGSVILTIFGGCVCVCF